MKHEEFNKIVDERLAEIKNRLTKKSDEYSSNDDKLLNFTIAARMENKTKQQIAWEYMRKHIISIYCMAISSNTFDIDLWAEKLGDIIGYSLLIEAIVKEERLNLGKPDSRWNNLAESHIQGFVKSPTSMPVYKGAWADSDNETDGDNC